MSEGKVWPSRWGAEDERGAANLIDAAATLRGVASVRTGLVVPLAIPIANGERGPGADLRAPPQHFMTRHGGDYAAGLPERAGYGFSDDVIMLPTHGVTHIDALAHVWRGGEMYNGFPATQVTSRGASRCGIERVGAFCTRAIFVDFAHDPSFSPEQAIEVDRLRKAVSETGITPCPGDALLMRTGWLKAWREGRADKASTAGLHHNCAPWIIEQEFSLLAADNIAVEVMPSRDPTCAMPLHIAVMRDHGVYLAELLDLELLSQLAPSAVMFVVAPLAIRGGVGSPVTPVAIL
ncbi:MULTISPECIES: cyclase family protein [unclassified Chelatococcus]|uniref:cyclase family protein n=1 Tax=unclassified Chelatococcus TaxID=2638111 RepID=UPI001BD03BC0|nr:MULTISPECIES: cyclase family protein [unclassified Chelatococcus]CAH1655218.1 Cyclase family protein [Hyphomicrobiales bacterium]MBS7742642.1 cyclase family protein [Chelatococcus sp. HY11]MBX3542240.1 cyclase family protein [Chelatococcus sp.]MCO5075544.1 cyclase family protein [Chelatococcus sp.]CAH1695375.1 Cyclase family protein [Hyphomicrobiales bacterium]